MWKSICARGCYDRNEDGRTSMKKAIRKVAILGVALAFGAAQAHHSTAMFDNDKTVKVAGTVKELQYTNPHSWLLVDVAGPDGKVVTWSFEAQGPSTLSRAGIKYSSLQPGDKVIVATHPMRDGRPGGLWICLMKGSELLVPNVGQPGTECRP
jgi:hypothetical protein